MLSIFRACVYKVWVNYLQTFISTYGKQASIDKCLPTRLASNHLNFHKCHTIIVKKPLVILKLLNVKILTQIWITLHIVLLGHKLTIWNKQTKTSVRFKLSQPLFNKQVQLVSACKWRPMDLSVDDNLLCYKMLAWWC